MAEPFRIPKFVDVELDYIYLPSPLTYKFLRRRERDAKADEQERMLGDGKRLTPAQRLSMLVEDVSGWPDLPSRRPEESEGNWRQRVLLYFDTDDMQEFAEEALAGRVVAVNPRPTFRSSADSRLAVDANGEEAGGKALVTLRSVHEKGTGPDERMPDLRTHHGPDEAEEGHQG